MNSIENDCLLDLRVESTENNAFSNFTPKVLLIIYIKWGGEFEFKLYTPKIPKNVIGQNFQLLRLDFKTIMILMDFNI